MSTLVQELIAQGKAPDLNRPRWTQKTLEGRIKHFFSVTNPLNLFTSDRRLDECQRIVDDYKLGHVPKNLTENQLWRAKTLYDSAFHPTTGEKLFLLGRMSSQVPCNMTITGFMLTFYKSTPAVVCWQWINQSYNALVNFANRSGEATDSSARLWTAYGCATGGAVTAALLLNKATRSLPTIVGRLVPFGAISIANMINIPIIRSNELIDGIEVRDEQDKIVGKSKVAANHAIPAVVISRIFMAIPFMITAPLIMERMVKTNFYKRRPWIAAPIQTMIAGFMLTFATPIGCALFPQRSEIAVKKLEPQLQAKVHKMHPINTPNFLYYNKGL